MKKSSTTMNAPASRTGRAVQGFRGRVEVMPGTVPPAGRHLNYLRGIAFVSRLSGADTGDNRRVRPIDTADLLLGRTIERSMGAHHRYRLRRLGRLEALRP